MGQNTMQALYDFLFEKPDIRKLKNELHQTTIFKTLTPAEIHTVSKYLQVRSFRKGERVFYEGDLGSALFIVLKGNVQISRISGIKKTIFADLSKGTFFGELALVHDVPRTASAVVTEESVLVCLFRNDFEKVIKHYPLLGNKLLSIINKILAQRLSAVIEETS